MHVYASYSFTIRSYIYAVGTILFRHYCYTGDLLSLEIARSYEANLPEECRSIVSLFKPDI